MIKQIWEVQNVRRLFSGLNFAILFITSIYSAASFAFLPDLIPTKFNFNGESIGYCNKIFVFVIPLLQLLSYLLFLFLQNKNNNRYKSNDTDAIIKINAIKSDALVANFFIIILAFALLQMNYLDSAKTTNAFGIFPIIIGAIAIIINYLYHNKKIKNVK